MSSYPAGMRDARNMSSRTGSVVGGLAVAGLGGFGMTLGLLRSPLLPPHLGSAPAHALTSVAGFLLLVGGMLLAVFTFRHVPEPAPVIPAHVAFMSRQAQPIAAPERVAVRRKPAPSRARTAKEQATMSKLDEEIRELTRKINKAGVMLATGQISHQGYASYVEELKKQRGALEASRVRIELHRD